MDNAGSETLGLEFRIKYKLMDKFKIITNEVEILDEQLKEKAQLEIKFQDELKAINERIIKTRGRLNMLAKMMGKE